MSTSRSNNWRQQINFTRHKWKYSRKVHSIGLWICLPLDFCASSSDSELVLKTVSLRAKSWDLGGLQFAACAAFVYIEPPGNESLVVYVDLYNYRYIDINLKQERCSLWSSYFLLNDYRWYLETHRSQVEALTWVEFLEEGLALTRIKHFVEKTCLAS